ncbi:hypothetical protein BV25DRAFT_1829289 [Artomyces pyxidatus]|uniref:Uncharacterized protein n=1 Tax=Artomyces pyxidatus TaxID=48021 RepID=A0ACB8SU49_9AGAM|nr:hypothetical protein BV25DRAFT_1829289 [Artomyces pyxidatus]
MHSAPDTQQTRWSNSLRVRKDINGTASVLKQAEEKCVPSGPFPQPDHAHFRTRPIMDSDPYGHRRSYPSHPNEPVENGEPQATEGYVQQPSEPYARTATSVTPPDN